MHIAKCAHAGRVQIFHGIYASAHHLFLPYAFSPSVCVTTLELFQSAFSAIPLFVFVFSVKENRRHTGDAEMSSDDESKENQYRFGMIGCNKRTEMNDIFIFTYKNVEACVVISVHKIIVTAV